MEELAYSVDMMLAVAEQIGAGLRQRWEKVLYGLGFFALVLRESVFFFRRGQVGYKVLVMQVLFTGFEALGIILVLSLALGTVVISQGYTLLAGIGQTKLLYSLLVIVITRELGPLLTAFIIIARSGTAIATELGTMVVNHEVEAYASVGINPVSYLVVPRFLGMIASLVLLTVYFNFTGLMVSFGVASLMIPLPLNEYASGLAQVMTLGDIATSLGKAVVFGAIISTVASHHGLLVQGSSTEVPQAGIRAVGTSFSLIILSNLAISALYYLG